MDDLPVIQDVAPASPAPARALAPARSGFYAEASGGPAFASYGARGGSAVAEHLADGGTSVAIGGGYGWELASLRIDAGLRLQNLRLGVRGAYSAASHDDTFRATYDYVFPTLSATFTSKLRGSHVNFFAGLSLGTATFVSDRQGSAAHARQLPLFGTFEGGLQITTTEWLDVRAGVAWLPPFDGLNVVSPTLGFRARF